MYANPKAEAGDRELLARDDVPRYIPVPGLGQDHQLDAALDDPNAAARAKFVKEYEQISRKMDDLGTSVDGSSEARKLAKLTGELPTSGVRIHRGG